MSKPVVVCLGVGGVGGYFGARLVEHDAADVTFLVRPQRKAALAARGLHLVSPHGNLTGLPIKARTAAELAGMAPDYVLLTCKAYDLQAAIADLLPVAGPSTAIVPLLNGISHLQPLIAAFGADRVMGGTVSLQLRQAADGTIEHLNDWQFITVGELDGGGSARANRLVSALAASGVTATASDNIRQKLWEKLVMLATLAAMTTLMRANVGTIARTPRGAVLMRQVLERNAQAAAYAGFAVPEEQLAQWRAMFADQTSTFSASMLADMELGKPVEADHIVGFMRDAVAASGLDPVLHDVAMTHLKAYEQNRLART